MLYLHETVDVHPEHIDEYGLRVAEVYRPAMEASGARFVALWETVPFSMPWPRFVYLWELDDIAAVNYLFETQYAGERETFAGWRRELGRLCTHFEGRMLPPSPGTPTLQGLRDQRVSVATCVHEWIRTTQNDGEQYCKQLESRYAPFAGIFNRTLVGTYHEIWNNREAINIWALPDQFTVFPDIAMTANNLAASTDVESWIVMSVGLREGYRSGLLRQVRLDGLAQR